ncbi:MAG TPA: hypothetical protein VJJ26_02775 [Candidatus Babeliales bacterium]|nr:hypothetical protein [Candidatus Babeliales bacterium]
MKKYIVITLLSLCTSICAMEQQKLRFDNQSILKKKLTADDLIHKNNYAPLAERSGFHIILGDKEHSRNKVYGLIRFCVELYNPNMPTNKVLEHRDRIVTILSANSKL